jgi:hypothetical protein
MRESYRLMELNFLVDDELAALKAVEDDSQATAIALARVTGKMKGCAAWCYDNAVLLTATVATQGYDTGQETIDFGVAYGADYSHVSVRQLVRTVNRQLTTLHRTAALADRFMHDYGERPKWFPTVWKPVWKMLSEAKGAAQLAGILQEYIEENDCLIRYDYVAAVYKRQQCEFNPYDSYEPSEYVLDAEDCIREIYECTMRARKEAIIAYNVAYDIYNRNRG